MKGGHYQRDREKRRSILEYKIHAKKYRALSSDDNGFI